MNNFIFENATKVFFGKGCVKEYLACLTKCFEGTVMLAYGGGSIKRNGIYDEVMESLKAEGRDVVEFPGIMANPTYEKVLEGAKLARENRVGLILGVGGGSVMDCCKAVSIAARYRGDVWEDFWARPGIFDIKANLDLFDFTLTDEEVAEIAALDQEKHYYTSTPEMLDNYVKMVPPVDEQK